MNWAGLSIEIKRNLECQAGLDLVLGQRERIRKKKNSGFDFDGNGHLANWEQKKKILEKVNSVLEHYALCLVCFSLI